MSVTPTQADREAAASFFGYDTWQDSQENGGTHGPIISARLAELLAHHAEQARLEGYRQGVADERERCAAICDYAAVTNDKYKFVRDADECRMLANAIRKGEA